MSGPRPEFRDVKPTPVRKIVEEAHAERIHRKGFSRLVVELPAELILATTWRAQRLRRPLARIVADALRAAIEAEP